MLLASLASSACSAASSSSVSASSRAGGESFVILMKQAPFHDRGRPPRGGLPCLKVLRPRVSLGRQPTQKCQPRGSHVSLVRCSPKSDEPYRVPKQELVTWRFVWRLD
eukprot:TRINITY_DN17572_c0_g3_i2.p2 TRINITY_DN17572_c0_g3~~TRINITY_DN17572_c0_g3_i2.p2  ORF type:complete len:108 (-),score=0.59 TRINITY_DN17572_c0_g3_i2:128-451(-)